MIGLILKKKRKRLHPPTHPLTLTAYPIPAGNVAPQCFHLIDRKECKRDYIFALDHFL